MVHSFQSLQSVLDRRAVLSLGGLALVTPKSLGAQALTAPDLSAPDAATRLALAPIYLRGASVWIDDLNAGPRAKTTVICRMPASIAQVRQVIASPLLYPEFLSVVRDATIDSTRGALTGFHFRAVASIFDLNVAASMRVTANRRVDINIVRSDFGPGAARWELFADGPGDTVVCCSTWGDPSQGHWLFRQIAQRGNASIALMTTAVNLMLSLALQRRIAALASRPIVAVDHSAEPLSPVPAAVRAVISSGVLGGITLTPQGALSQASASYVVPCSLDRVEQALRQVTQYPAIWRAMRNVRPLAPDADGGVRFSSEIETTFARSSGSRRLTLQRNGEVLNAVWTGLSGAELGHTTRWDAVQTAPSRVLLSATVGDQVNRVGFPFRATLEREPSLRAGFALGLASVWARSLANHLSP